MEQKTPIYNQLLIKHACCQLPNFPPNWNQRRTSLSKSSFLLQFEYQQAQLEAEIENLSWKIEHAETTDRGDLENQIDVAEKRRTSLLKDFLTS